MHARHCEPKPGHGRQFAAQLRGAAQVEMGRILLSHPRSLDEAELLEHEWQQKFMFNGPKAFQSGHA
jgi:hypothetical protein